MIAARLLIFFLLVFLVFALYIEPPKAAALGENNAPPSRQYCIAKELHNKLFWQCDYRKKPVLATLQCVEYMYRDKRFPIYDSAETVCILIEFEYFVAGEDDYF